MRVRAQKILLLAVLAVAAAAGLQAEAVKLRVTAEQANIREKPDITSVILLQVQEGRLLEAEKKEGEWYAVRVAQEGGEPVTGYVHESLVTVVEPPKLEEKAEPAREKPAPERKEPRVLPRPPVRPSPEPEARPERFSLSLWWGARVAGVGDLNAGAEGLAQYYASALGVTLDGGIKPVRAGFLAGGEVQWPLGSGFFFAAGAEYFSAKVSSSVSFGQEVSPPSFLTTPAIQAIPLSLSILFYPARFLSLRAGLEYTLVRSTYLYRFEDGDIWQKWKGQANASVLSYHLGLGTDWALSRHVSLVAEALYRRSTVTGFEGEAVYQESSGYETSVKGKLYFFQQATSGDESVSLLFLREKAPTDPGVSDVREAELDLRGLSLRAGLKIRF